MIPGADVLASGGVIGLILALAYIGRLLLDWIKERKTDKTVGVTVGIAEKTAAMSDASTVNAMILSSLEAVTDENGRLRSRVESSEAENARLRGRIETLENEIAVIAAELRTLREK